MGLPSMVFLIVGLVLITAATSLVLVTERLPARQWKLDRTMRAGVVLIVAVAMVCLIAGAAFAIHRVII